MTWAVTLFVQYRSEVFLQLNAKNDSFLVLNTQSESPVNNFYYSKQMSEAISNQSSQVNIQGSDSSKSCRICLLQAHQHREEEQLDFIAPCRCSGSLQYVHHVCLLRWMNTQLLRSRKLGKDAPQVKCEICKQEYRAKMETLWQISSCQKMKEIYKQNFNNKLLLVASILLILVCLGSLTLFVYLLKADGISTTNKEEQLTGYIVAFVVVGGALIAWIFILIKTYIVKRIQYFVKVYDKDEGLQMLQREEQEKSGIEKIEKKDAQTVDSSLPGLEIYLE